MEEITFFGGEQFAGEQFAGENWCSGKFLVVAPAQGKYVFLVIVRGIF
jgi:hypothetical protein